MNASFAIAIRVLISFSLVPSSVRTKLAAQVQELIDLFIFSHFDLYLFFEVFTIFDILAFLNLIRMPYDSTTRFISSSSLLKRAYPNRLQRRRLNQMVWSLLFLSPVSASLYPRLLCKCWQGVAIWCNRDVTINQYLQELTVISLIAWLLIVLGTGWLLNFCPSSISNPMSSIDFKSFRHWNRSKAFS